MQRSPSKRTITEESAPNDEVNVVKHARSAAGGNAPSDGLNVDRRRARNDVRNPTAAMNAPSTVMAEARKCAGIVGLRRSIRARSTAAT